MRRVVLATVAAALVVTACGERESPTEPSVPQPEETFGSSCTVDRFPLLTVARQIADVFPKGRLRVEALARAGIIKLYWDTCHEGPARRIAVSFIDWMNLKFDAGALPDADEEEVQTLTVTILNGVGVGVEAPASGGHIGVGIYDGDATEEQYFTTTSKCFLTAIQPDAFETNANQDRLIVTKDLPGFRFDEEDFAGAQFDPFWDVDATLLSGQTTPQHKVLKSDKEAVVAAVLLPGVEYPNNVQIGHKPFEGTGLPFELLVPVQIGDEEVDGEDRQDLKEKLTCTDPGASLRLGFEGGLPGLAQAAWGSTVRNLTPVAQMIFLPTPAHATTVGFSGPIGGKTTSLSPFGVVEVGEAPTTITFASDPSWLPASQNVCLNPSIPANCPAGATVYTPATSGWGANLSSIPGAFWIWSAEVTPGTYPAFPAEFSFSKSFSLSTSQLAGSISIAADDYAQVIVNDHVVGDIGSRTDGTLAAAAQGPLITFDIGPFLVAGTNLITVNGANGNFGCGAGAYSCNPAGVVFGGWLGQAPVIIE